MKQKIFISITLAVLPSVSFADAPFGGINDYLDQIKIIISKGIPLAFALAVLFFFYGIARFVLAAGNPTAKAEGKSIMVWGVIALFVMTSIWGLIQFLGTELQISNSVNGGSSAQVPVLQISPQN